MKKLIKICCPFHDEKTPSFVTNGYKYVCFGCGKEGLFKDLDKKVIDTIQRIQNDR